MDAHQPDPDRTTAPDLLVLGAGATGLGVASTARAAGHSVTLVEQDRPGGDCTWSGCVPSKTLLETARRVAAARDGSNRGYDAEVHVDFRAVMAHVHRVIDTIARDESPALLRSQGIGLVTGRARFVGPRTVEVTRTDDEPVRLRAHRVVIATGAGPSVPDVPGLAEVGHLTNETVFGLTEQPGHLVVLGGGPIGCELSQAFARLGSRVTIVHTGTRLLPKDEPEAARAVQAALERDGVEVLLDRRVTTASRTSAGPVLTLADGSRVTGSHLLVAAGRTPRTAELGLDAAGVRTDPAGRVVVDRFLRTSAAGVLAAGDCASALNFTHVGYEQGRLAAGNAFAAPHRPGLVGGPRRWDDRVVPWVTYTSPEVGRVGLTEAQAYERYGARALVSLVPDRRSDRARCAGETDGFVKLVAVLPPGPARRVRVLLRLVGMTAVGPVGGELVAQGALAMRAGTPLGRIAQTIHAYPTWSLGVRYAAAAFFTAEGSRAVRPARPEHG